MNHAALIVALLGAAGCAAASTRAVADPPPQDPVAFAKLARAQLQEMLPDLVVEMRNTALVFRTREGDSLGMTVASMQSICRDSGGDCSAALSRYVASTGRLFRTVADARREHGDAAPAPAEPLLTHAVWADGRLWMRSASGALSSLAPSGAEPEPDVLPEPVAALCAEDDHPVVATCRQPGCKAWTLRRHVAGQWRTFATVASSRDQLLGMSCASGEEALLTTRRLVQVNAGREHAVALSEPLAYSDTAALLARHDGVYVGFNQGEFGGGLRRVDPRSGRVAALQQPDTVRPCRGLLVPSCDPVHAIVTTPWDPDCVAVAVGLVHTLTHGRIVEICGDRLHELYAQPAGPPQPRAGRNPTEPASSVAFTGLAASGDELVAVGNDGTLYRIARDGAAQVVPAPPFRRAGEVSVSFDAPDLALVHTDVYRRNSVSGALPMLVPR